MQFTIDEINRMADGYVKKLAVEELGGLPPDGWMARFAGICYRDGIAAGLEMATNRINSAFKED